MAMDVTWLLEDLDLYENRIGVGEATFFTISETIVLAMGIIAQTTFYKMMKRLPGRVINQILYQHMVSTYYRGSPVSMVFGDTLFSKIMLKFYVFGTIHTLTLKLI